VLRVGGDGNCLFRALVQSAHLVQSALLCPTLWRWVLRDASDVRAHRSSCADKAAMSAAEETAAAAALRREVVAEMQCQRGTLQFFVTSPWDSYVAAMAQSGCWGGKGW